ncbi:MAG: NAD(P)H-dependent oxidoreductase [Deltaproteobacteria bacterium]|nr:NAD(P)H-dependent oxidoreductase [Deltaproteobacteria bacterium]
MTATKAPTIFVACGSIRPQSYTRMAMELVCDELRKQGATVDAFDPRGIKIPFLGASFPETLEKDLQKRVKKADGLILCTPEYNSTYSSVMMSIVENLGYPSVCVGKVLNLLGVASGGIGAIRALDHLQTILVHNGAIVLPGSVSIAGVHKIFDEKGKCSDKTSEEFIRSVASSLLFYLRTGKVNQVGIKKV